MSLSANAERLDRMNAWPLIGGGWLTPDGRVFTQDNVEVSDIAAYIATFDDWEGEFEKVQIAFEQVSKRLDNLHVETLRALTHPYTITREQAFQLIGTEIDMPKVGGNA